MVSPPPNMKNTQDVDEIKIPCHGCTGCRHRGLRTDKVFFCQETSIFCLEICCLVECCKKLMGEKKEDKTRGETALGNMRILGSWKLMSPQLKKNPQQKKTSGGPTFDPFIS